MHRPALRRQSRRPAPEGRIYVAQAPAGMRSRSQAQGFGDVVPGTRAGVATGVMTAALALNGTFSGGDFADAAFMVLRQVI